MTSKPSKPRNPPSDPERSTTSWTIPGPADVISYAYLWSHEAAAGQDEGLKDRPVVVVLARIVDNGRTQLLVAPITHSPPEYGASVQLPLRIKRHLGLDDEPSWIVTTEVNRFMWPGPDVRVAMGFDSPLYGALPAKLFDQVKQQISTNARAGRASTVRRTE